MNKLNAVAAIWRGRAVASKVRGAKAGFTIVELLIVIVVIAILAAITIVAFNGVQTRARNSKINEDLASLNKGAQLARIAAGNVTLMSVTGSNGTAANCEAKVNGTDLAALPKTDGCWTSYAAALTAIYNASGVDVRNLVDPWGRPYFMDENEGEGSVCGAGKDNIGAYPQPFVNGWGSTNTLQIPYSNPSC